jgi:MFS family permease
MTVVWAVAFGLVLGSGVLPAALTVGALVVAAVVFGAGECILGPAHSPIVVELASPELRGRYLSLLTMSYAIGFTLGPPLAAAGLSISPNGVWVVAASVCLLAGALGLVLEKRLPASLTRTPIAR